MAAVRSLNLLSPPRRVSLRRRTPDGALGDVVGHVVGESEAGLTVLPEDRPAVRVSREDIVAIRDVPPRVVRPGSSSGDLARLLAVHWPGLEQARLNGWLLRAGAGFTKRANSVLVDGDPGVSQGQAVALVEDWYAARGIDPHLYVLGTTERAEPRAGWEALAETQVWVADLRRLAPVGSPVGAGDTTVEITDRPDRSWLTLWRAGAADEATALRVLSAAPARYLLLSRDGEATACLRLGIDRRWAHISCLAVRPDARGRGLGRLAACVALERARREGAAFGAVEVESANEVALRLYRGLGLHRHHDYHYQRRALHNVEATTRPGAKA